MPERKQPTSTPVAVLLRWLRRVALTLSLGVLAGVTLCFAGRWDTVAVVTLPPFWGWALVGLVPLLVAWRIRGGWLLRIALAVWLVSAVAWSDDLRCLFQSPFAGGGSGLDQPTNQQVRVVSLNCAGLPSAAREIGPYKPDIVLLQESPGSNEVARLVQEWFGQEGGMIYAPDCSILARGQLKVIHSPHSLRFLWGEVRLADGLGLDVVSVRLHPPDVRMDLWSAECWRQHTRGRELRRSQLQELMVALQVAPRDKPVILGGDFNAPAGDGIFRLLRPMLKDCFCEAGRGWGNTALNTIPISRPDQIWASRRSVARRVCARRTENSDHRMVIADVIPR